MNQDLRKKNETMQDYSYTPFNKLLKYSVIGFGLLSNIANSYYLGIAFATVIVPLVGVPLSSIIIYFTIISGLTFYYARGVTNTMRLTNPNKEEYDALKIKLIEFSDNYKNDLTDALAIRNEIDQIPKQMRACSTGRLMLFGKYVQESTNENDYDIVFCQQI